MENKKMSNDEIIESIKFVHDNLTPEVLSKASKEELMRYVQLTTRLEATIRAMKDIKE